MRVKEVPLLLHRAARQQRLEIAAVKLCHDMAHADKAAKQAFAVNIVLEMLDPLPAQQAPPFPVFARLAVNRGAQIAPVIAGILPVIRLAEKPVEFLPARKRGETLQA